MKIRPFESVGALKFGTSRTIVIDMLGLPVRERVSYIGELELHYPEVIYRFNETEELVEISFDAPIVEFDEDSVSFENLVQFLKNNDCAMFEKAGFVVSPEFGIAFDPNCPSWITAFPKESIPLWQK